LIATFWLELQCPWVMGNWGNEQKEWSPWVELNPSYSAWNKAIVCCSPWFASYTPLYF